MRVPRAAWAPPNARVVWGRAEEQELDWAGVAVAKALAQPPIAAEWCLPLVRAGRRGRALGRAVGRAATASRGSRRGSPASSSSRPAGFLVIRKTGPTPPGFPRRPGVAKKRPLA